MRPDRTASLALAALVAATLCLRPLAHGVAPVTLAAFWATVLGQVVLPGVLLVRGAGLAGSGEPWLLVGQGATLGVALQGGALLLGRALGAPWLTTLVALVTVACGLLLARRAPPAAPSAGAGVPAPSLTLAVALVALLLQPLASAARPGEPVPFDLLFHAGTAGELRHRWPLEDPRVAGVPLHYHLLAYALPIEAADLARAPLADTLLALAPLLWVGLLALQLTNAGRALLGDARAGALGAAVALFHADPGFLLGPEPWAFGSHFATAVFGSPTTACSFVLLAGLVVALQGWLEGGRRRDLATVALLSAAASATKTTLLPVVLGGFALAAAWAHLAARRADRNRLAAAFAFVTAAALPFTAWQTLGDSSYSRMAHFGLFTAFTGSGFVAHCARWLGGDAVSGVTAFPVFLAWLMGFLGLGGVAAALWLAGRRERLTATQAWALLTIGVALAASQLVDAPGLSQLFLLYNGQLLLCLFAGAGLVSAWPVGRRASRLAAALLLVVAALPPLATITRALPLTLASDAASWKASASPMQQQYAQALAWLRAHASRDAVVFADNPSLLLSALGELRLYYETGLYTARGWEVGPERDPFPERTALQERLLRRPDREAIAAARGAVAPGARVLIVADAVQSRIEAGFVHAEPGPVPGRRLFAPELFELLFANRALHVYEARP